MIDGELTGDDSLAWWWTLTDANQGDQTVYPLGLAMLVEKYLREGAPAAPVHLSG